MSDVSSSSLKARCSAVGCRCKLKLSDFACRCGQKFCPTHRPSWVHSCTHDYKADQKDFLLKHMSTVITAKKVDII
jgi:hypothetical protein